MNKILVLNGPNLNLLGTREPEIYGKHSLKDIETFTSDHLKKFGFDISVEWFQSNSESDLVTKIQSSQNDFDAIVINPAAYTHTSVAILDALKTFKKPIVEVHLSNTNTREEFRKNKVTTLASQSVIEGAGHRVYLLGILSLLIS